ncbi:hypothetical protein GCM10008098_06190 [Rhodanobacter panaciterrae]|uniref:Lipoprotein n=1 Tax=Rhodanobacter panaciterrae TaxID=490572 RepID=A0ABQ2ZLM8_9GAMM|nr:hypothetical protein [Rhodanobacter panaciterrae]GGY17342.1 hypothetical protein GCM10008098_06190 [Rhodanobacter panaciterrae]
MKKTSLLVALPAVALSGLLLTGCGMFRSHKAWDTAQQQSPLEIPPSLDRPSTSDALVIPPPGANQPTSSGATASVGGVAGQMGQVSDGFVHAGSVDSVYAKVGEALAGGTLGQLVSHDDAAHSYVVAVTAAAGQKKKGFFGRMFGRDKSDSASTVGTPHQVQISINSSGADGSEIRAQSDSIAAVAKVIDTLKSSIGKK